MASGHVHCLEGVLTTNKHSYLIHRLVTSVCVPGMYVTECECYGVVCV